MKGIFTLLVLVTILFASVQYAEAEPLTITANNGKMDLSIIIDGDSNTVKIQTEKSLFQHWDSYVKYFKSGAFKVSSKYMLLFVSPISDGQYKIAYITSDGIQRFTGNKVIEIKYGEPKSSVGADITKYDIPNVGRPELSGANKPIHPMIKTDEVSYVYINEEYTPNISIVNYWDAYTGIKDAKVNLKITRDGITIQEINGVTGLGGLWNPSVNVSFPTYYPTFCYDVTITTQYGNNTSTAQDDFIVTNTGYWNYLDQFGNELVNIKSDTECNE